MNELVTQLTQRFGLSPDQAREAIQIVFGYVKGRLPAPIASEIDGLLGQPAPASSGATASTGGLGTIATELGGLLNR